MPTVELTDEVTAEDPSEDFAKIKDPHLRSSMVNTEIKDDHVAIKDTETGKVLKLFRRKACAPPRIMSQYRLLTDKHALSYSIMAVRCVVLSLAVSSTMLQPNFPFIASGLPELYPDAFQSTGPFGFSSATYFLPVSVVVASDASLL